jgi:predicted alpha/beta hydrolase family esterase
MTRKELEDLLIKRVGHNYWQYPETSMWYIKVLKYLEQRKKKEIEVV